MADADNVINPQRCGSDPADILIEIRINPGIRIDSRIIFGCAKRLGGGLRSLGTV